MNKVTVMFLGAAECMQLRTEINAPQQRILENLVAEINKVSAVKIYLGTLQDDQS